jgi:hypothetical protein
MNDSGNGSLPLSTPLSLMRKQSLERGVCFVKILAVFVGVVVAIAVIFGLLCVATAEDE